MKLTPSMRQQQLMRSGLKKLAKIQRDIQDGSITINQAREMMGLRPFPDAECDILMKPSPASGDGGAADDPEHRENS